MFLPAGGDIRIRNTKGFHDRVLVKHLPALIQPTGRLERPTSGGYRNDQWRYLVVSENINKRTCWMEFIMSSEVQSPLFTVIAFSLIVFGLTIVGLVSGLIPGVYPAKSGAVAAVLQSETQAETAGTTSAAIGKLVGTVIVQPEAATGQTVNNAASPALMAEAGSKNP